MRKLRLQGLVIWPWLYCKSVGNQNLNPGLFYSIAKTINHYILWSPSSCIQDQLLLALDFYTACTWFKFHGHSGDLSSTHQTWESSAVPFLPALGDLVSWVHVHLLVYIVNPWPMRTLVVLPCLPTMLVHREIQLMPLPGTWVSTPNDSPTTGSGTWGMSLNLSGVIFSSLKIHIKVILQRYCTDLKMITTTTTYIWMFTVGQK